MPKPLIKVIGRFLVKNSPTIMATLGGAGAVSTAILGIKATPKALLLIEEEVRRKYSGYNYRVLTSKPLLSKKEVIKITWHCYIPTMIMGGVTLACIFYGNSLNLKRNAALASMYTLAETTLKEYQNKVVEVVGEKKAKKIEDEVYEEEIKKHPVDISEITITGRGDTLCYERTSGRYFKSDIENIRRVRNNLNELLLSDGFVKLNELYYELGLPETSIGEYWGWDISKGQIDIKFSSQLTQHGTPCLVIDSEPTYFSD